LLTIDLAAAAANWRALDVLSGAAVTGAAVKADGYGCGAVEVATALTRAGCDTFFVATIEEGVALREALPDPTLYILNGVTDRRDAAAAIVNSLRPCLNHLGQIDAWQRSEGGACALQLDSGMSRLGLPPAELPDVPDGLDVHLVMSHLSCADEPDHHSNATQRARFLESCDLLAARTPKAKRSLAATGGTVFGPEYHFDLVRCGVGIYGGHPFVDAQPVVRLDTPILQIRDIPAGQSVGYGWAWTADRPSRIATLPLGYADGMHRALSNNATLFFEGEPVPLVGRVSMDLITVDLTDCPSAKVGDTVEVLGPNQSVDDLAEAAGTIGYEILTSLGQRYARRYTGGEI
jgi:alanine racemase